MNGLVIGKFYPLHRGHEFLIGFAQAHCDHLHVVVCSLPTELIDGEIRARWVRERFPNVIVHHLDKVLPQYPEEAPDFWAQWTEALNEVVNQPIEVVYTSESYGEGLANCFGARWIAPDVERGTLQLSATTIRENIWDHWSEVPEVVQRDLRKRVVVFGPESTGKTTLSERLASHFQTLAVPEFARTFITRKDEAGSETRDPLVGGLHLSDMDEIAKGQQALVNALEPLSGAVLICDTDQKATALWSQALFGEVSPEVVREAESAVADLYLLCDVDVPWVDDPVRFLPEERASFFDACEAALADERVVVIRGDWETRWEVARTAVEDLLRELSV